MIKKEYVDVIKEEVARWEKRVYFPDLKFKEGTKADLDLLKENVTQHGLRDTMMILASETESCIYKIGRTLVEHGVKNDKITFLDGDILLPYVDADSKYKWRTRQLIDELLDNLEKEISKKWVIIPELNIEWEKEAALYFMAKLKKMNVYGVLFYCSKNVSSNLAQIIVEETYLNILEFPASRYTPKREKRIEDDEY